MQTAGYWNKGYWNIEMKTDSGDYRHWKQRDDGGKLTIFESNDIDEGDEPDPCAACGDLLADVNDDGYCRQCDRDGSADRHREYLANLEAEIDEREADPAPCWWA